MLQAFIDGWMVVEEKFDDGRWLDIGEVLICKTGHRAFEGFEADYRQVLSRWRGRRYACRCLVVGVRISLVAQIEAPYD